MNTYDKKISKLEELDNIQRTFEESIKNLEKNIAESITNKKKLKEIQIDLSEANKKFIDAERYLEDLEIELKNTQHSSDIVD